MLKDSQIQTDMDKMPLPIFRPTKSESNTITSFLETFGGLKVSWLVVFCLTTSSVLFLTLSTPLLLSRSTVPFGLSSQQSSETPFHGSSRRLLTSVDIAGDISLSQVPDTTVSKSVTTRTGLIEECKSGFLTVSCLTPSFCTG